MQAANEQTKNPMSIARGEKWGSDFLFEVSDE